MNSKWMEPEEAVQLLAENKCFLDVRSESEYAESHFVGAFNLPILKDKERQLVGLCYKQKGQAAAIELGHKLVSGATKAERLKAWKENIQKHQLVGIYCWRGGLRSETAQSWLCEADLEIPRIKGGYKAIRRLLLNELEKRPTQLQFFSIAGETGAGKTQLLHEISDLFSVVDLESLAHHRGSAFGAWSNSQPPQASFENNLAIKLLQSHAPVFLEAESRALGKLNIPETLYTEMLRCPLLVLELDREKRTSRLIQEYVVEEIEDRMKKGSNFSDAVLALKTLLLDRLSRLQKKLGGLRMKECADALEFACARSIETQNYKEHREWIERLLLYYYDPYYQGYLQKNSRRIIFKGSAQDIKAFIQKNII